MVRSEPARRLSEASSSDLSIWPKPAMPARIPTGTLRITIEIMTMAAVPVRYTGALLKARMYDTPATVPGTAKHSMVVNSMVFLPLNCWRTTIHAISRPKIAVIGAAIPA